MENDLTRQAYALAVLAGPPVFDVMAWCRCITDLAADAAIADLTASGQLNELVSCARTRGAEAPEPEDSARLTLLAEWLANARQTLGDTERLPKIWCKEFELAEFFEHCRTQLEELGVAVPTSTAFEVVEQFPKPFDREDWSAFCPDPVDEKRFGIPAGIYLRRDRIRPFQTACLVAHEVIHVVPGLKDGDLLAMGLEEGIADLYGSLLLAGRLLGQRLAQNAFTYSRLGPPRPLGMAYLAHARQALTVYARHGTPGLTELVNGGRTAIHRAEQDLTAGRLPQLRSPVIGLPDDYGQLARLISGGLPHLVVSPLEYQVGRAARLQGRNIDEVASALNLSAAVVTSTLKSLAEKTMMVVLNDDVIEFSNLGLYLPSDDAIASTTLRVDLAGR